MQVRNFEVRLRGPTNTQFRQVAAAPTSTFPDPVPGASACDKRVTVRAKKSRAPENPPEKPVSPIALPQSSPFPVLGRGGFTAMRGRIGCRLLVLFGVLASTWASAACVDPAQLADSTVSLMR